MINILKTSLAGSLWLACAVSSFAIEATLTDDNYGATDHSKAALLKINATNPAQLTFSLDNLPDGLTAGEIRQATLTVFASAIRKTGAVTVTGAGQTTNPLNFGVGDVRKYVTSDVTTVVKAQFTQASLTFNLTTTGADVSIDSKENTATSHPARLEIELKAPSLGQNHAGLWQAATAYASGQIVSFNGSSFVALADSTGVTPGTDGMKWALLSMKGDKGDKGDTGAAGTSAFTAAMATTSPQFQGADQTISNTLRIVNWTQSPFANGGTYAGTNDTFRPNAVGKYLITVHLDLFGNPFTQNDEFLIYAVVGGAQILPAIGGFTFPTNYTGSCHVTASAIVDVGVDVSSVVKSIAVGVALNQPHSVTLQPLGYLSIARVGN